MFDILHNGSYVSVGAPYRNAPYKDGKPKPDTEMIGYTDKEADAHKVTPEEETYYNDPEYGTETNAYANIPERVRGQYDVPSIETLLGKTSAEVIRYTLDIHDSHRGELFGKVEALSGDNPVGYVQFSEMDADIETSDTRYWTEEEDEYGGRQWSQNADYPREVHIKYVYVNPEYRRKGVGTGMYEKIKLEFPGEKIVSSGTTDEGGKFRNKLLERGVLSKLKSAGPQGAGQPQHTNHQTYGMSKALKSDPFAVEREELALSEGGNRPAPNPALPIEDSSRKLESNGGGGFKPTQGMDAHLSSVSPVIKEEANSLRLEVGGKKIGYIGYRVDQVGKKKYAEISGLEVDPAWRRQGWGTKLYEALAAKAKREGISFITSNLSGMTSNDAEGVWTRLINKGYNIEEVDSVDSETGKPYYKWKVAKAIGPVYHGTGEAFEEYHSKDGLYYFTDDPKYAELFTNRIAPGRTLEGANIRRAYITMNHPFDARSWGNETETIDGITEILGMEPGESLGYNTYQGAMPFWQWVRNYPKRVREILMRQGYDGIIQDENHPGAGYAEATAYIVFNTNQIKWTMAKEGAGPVHIDWDNNMYGKFKLTVEYAWHEYGDEIDTDADVNENNWNLLIVNAFDTTKKQGELPGKWVGSAEFVLRHGDLESCNTEVTEEYRRQGIATAIYQFAEGFTGYATSPHNEQSPAGQGLWKQKGRPFGQNA
jgi:GNAT superfamily N-acetyltransferase